MDCWIVYVNSKIIIWVIYIRRVWVYYDFFFDISNGLDIVFFIFMWKKFLCLCLSVFDYIIMEEVWNVIFFINKGSELFIKWICLYYFS